MTIYEPGWSAPPLLQLTALLLLQLTALLLLQLTLAIGAPSTVGHPTEDRKKDSNILP